MGIYLLIIAIKDVQWKGQYFKKDNDWRNGLMCQFTGAISMLSSEVSVLMLTIITADRFKAIVFPMRFRKLPRKHAIAVCLVTWAFGLLMVVLPMTGMAYFYDEEREFKFFGRSSVCLPLQLSSDRPSGWEYSVSFFIGMNFAAFMFIFFAYAAMFWKMKRSSSASKSKNVRKEAAMARKVFFIILTDFCCWMPVIIMGILSLTDNFDDPGGLAFAWIAVFILPINSAINPILYTFANDTVREKCLKFCKPLFCKSTPPGSAASAKGTLRDSGIYIFPYPARGTSN